MLSPLFIVPLFQYDVKDWIQKKELILNLIDYDNLQNSKVQNFYSDKNKASYTDEVFEILKDEFTEFIEELGAREIDVHTAWTVNYKRGDFHPPHTHSSMGYSGILYLNYKEDHTPTYFIDPIIDPVYDCTNIISPEAKEGRLAFVPSNVLHFTYPNTSDNNRTIIGFDIRINS